MIRKSEIACAVATVAFWWFLNEMGKPIIGAFIFGLGIGFPFIIRSFTSKNGNSDGGNGGRGPDEESPEPWNPDPHWEDERPVTVIDDSLSDENIRFFTETWKEVDSKDE